MKVRYAMLIGTRVGNGNGYMQRGYSALRLLMFAQRNGFIDVLGTELAVTQRHGGPEPLQVR